MPKFIQVVVTATGRKQWVPEHFLGNPVLGAGIALPPSQRDKELPEGDPTDSWTRKQLDAYAVGLGIGTADLPRKADVLAAIADHLAAVPGGSPDDPADGVVDTTQTTDGTESSDETPA